MLTELFKNGKKFMWSEESDRAFVELRSRLTSGPILRAPEFDTLFCVASDAAQFRGGACLFQVTDEVEHHICNMSRKLLVHEVRYSLALVLAVRAFSICSGLQPVIVYTDHSPIQFISQMAN